MKSIPLTKGYTALVSNSDYEELSQFNWSVVMPGGPSSRRRYAIRFENGKGIYMHRQILADELTPERNQCDHIDGDGLNNLRNNLRPCTRSENQRNRSAAPRKGRSSQFKGVTRTPSGWRAQIVSLPRQRQMFLGTFESEIVAARAYDQAAISYHGQFARLNFPQSEAR
jgi:AP2 domain